MKKSELYLSLGTNLGNRENNINQALEMLEEAFGHGPERVSDIIGTEAVGFVGPPFLNCIAVFRTGIRPGEVLRICKRIERKMGRTDSPEYDSAGKRVYHDRIIDIDILLYGEVVMDTPNLKIPHPQVESRAFIKELLLTL